MSNGTNTARKLQHSESETDCSTMPPSSAMSVHSLVKGTPQAIREWLMSLAPVSPASHLVSAGTNRAKTTPATCGRPLSSAYASYDHDSRSWKTSQACLFSTTYSAYSETWPRAGMMRTGVCWEVTPPIVAVTASDFGLSLLRPTAQCWKAWTFLKLSSLVRKNHSDGNIQEQFARVFHRMITPESNEILMQWPKGWSGLKPLEMDRIRSWSSEHGACWPEGHRAQDL